MSVSSAIDVQEIGRADWHSRVRAPARDTGDWDAEADVVIVGLGGAGVCAAIEALDAGASVIAIDRFVGGGATFLSGGVVYAGGGTRQQQEAGVKDDPGNMFDYLRLEVQNAVSEATLRDFCEGSRDDIAWLEQQGVRFDSTLSPVKTSYPSEGHFLYYSGNEAHPDFAVHASPAQRGHRTVGKHLTGYRFFGSLLDTALAKGLRVLPYSDARNLIIDDGGAVGGVEISQVEDGSAGAKKLARLNRKFASPAALLFSALGRRIVRQAEEIVRTHGRQVRIKARRGVILAAGGYIQNREMVRQFAPAFLDATPLGGIGCDGSGLRLGQTVGGQLDRMERVSAWRQFQPPAALAKGIIVDGHGDRIIAEDHYGGTVGHEIAQRDGGKAWIVIDAGLRREALRDVLSGQGRKFSLHGAPVLAAILVGSRKGRTLAHLASKTGMDPDRLAAAVAHYNRSTDGLEPSSFRKDPRFTARIADPPFYAIDISLGSKHFLCPSISLGGLVVDHRTGQVLDKQGNAVPGLYAAGKNAVGISSHFYVSGLSLADCVYSGRNAGRHAASA